MRAARSRPIIRNRRHDACIQYNRHPLWYRVGTGDVHVIYSILFKKGKKAGYWIPRPLQPTTIPDIGGNIGAAAIYLAKTYPDARVLTFEPMPENFCNGMWHHTTISTPLTWPSGFAAPRWSLQPVNVPLGDG